MSLKKMVYGFVDGTDNTDIETLLSFPDKCFMYINMNWIVHKP